MLKVTTRSMASEVREAVLQALLATNQRAKMAGALRDVGQEAYGCALVAGVLEAIGVVLSEAFKEEPSRLVEFFPRAQDVILHTTKHLWKHGHLPDCGCPDS